MASTYDNDLRLNEMATGDQSGTWGDTTNLNLRLIAETFHIKQAQHLQQMQTNK